MKHKKIWVIIVILLCFTGFIGAKADVAAEKAAGDMASLDSLNWVIPLRDATYMAQLESVPGVICIEEGGKYGLIDQMGETIVPLIYDYIEANGKEELLAAASGGLYGYMDAAGRVVIPFRYEKAQSFVGEYGVVYAKDACAVINKSGEILYEKPHSAELAVTEKEGVFSYKNGEYVGLMDADGKILLPADRYTRLVGYGEGCWLFSKYYENPMNWYRYVYLDEDFNQLFKDKLFINGELFSQGFASVEVAEEHMDGAKPPKQLNQRVTGFMDRSGEMLETGMYTDIKGLFREGLAIIVVYKDDDRAYRLMAIDTDGKVVFELPRASGYMAAGEYFSEGYMPMMENKENMGSHIGMMPGGTYKYVDRSGRAVTDGIFQSAGAVKNGMAVVCYGGRWGVISMKGL